MRCCDTVFQHFTEMIACKLSCSPLIALVFNVGRIHLQHGSILSILLFWQLCMLGASMPYMACLL